MPSGDAAIAASYFLGKDVHVCASSGHAVFLDLNSGRYMTLNQRAARSLSRYVVGWPIRQEIVQPRPESSGETHQLLDQLVHKGLLTRELAADQSVAPPTIASPAATLLDSIYMHEPVIRPHHVASFLLCSYRARAYLRWRGIKGVIERARRQKAAIPATEGLTDPERTRTLTAIFNRLQPLALDGRDGCLLQSFAHREFLVHHGLIAQWVFAVRAIPFTAHCWLQQGSLVLNDVPQRAGYLSPILVV